MKAFRDSNPRRTCKSKYAAYTAYKSALRKDFGKTCGYCDDLDTQCGGKNTFHIDHFRPLNHYEHLECDYSNLVYACSYCNIAKSDDWPCVGTDLTYNAGKGYIDPCDADFPNHFERYDNGRIKPKTDVGKYMFEQLKLGLRRHELLWLIKNLFAKLQEVHALYKEHKHGSRANELAVRHMELFEEYAKYKGLHEEGI